MIRINLYLLVITLLSGCSMPSKIIENGTAKSKKVTKIEKVEKTEKVVVLEKPVLHLEKVFVPAKGPVWKKTLSQTKVVSKFCKKIDRKFHHWGWGKSRCKNIKWNNVRTSHLGDPLIWTVYGDESTQKENPKDMTLILCGVHGDEITPIKFCFDIIHHLEKISKGHLPGFEELKGKLVAVAPIVTPDSFFKRRPTRTNARGVDVNRNFPTRDWKKSALKLWKKRYRKDKRRYPGKKSLSEQETIFQVNLIKRYIPTKIISVHAPLTIIDYDGPEFHDHKSTNSIQSMIAPNAKQLLVQMSKKANGYRIKNYPFFPGSLGNYAGNERKIPTYTLELPTADNRKHKKYWSRFKDAIHSAILHDMHKDIEVAKVIKEKKSKVSTN